MVRTIFISVLAIGCLGAAARAAENVIRITAGEHESYSRLVVAEGAKSTSIDQEAGVVEVRFDNAGEFDLSDVNDKQKARRVSGARVLKDGSGSVVRFALNCACSVNTSRLANGKLVIDIAATELADADEQALAASQPVRLSKESAAVSEDVSLTEAHERMIQLLQRAANDGIITVRESSSELSQPASAQPPQKAAAQSVESPEVSEPLQAKASAAACLPDSALSISSPQFDEDPLEAISVMRQQLADSSETDRTEIARTFALGYLAIGFGEEALALLEGNGEENSPYAEVARIVSEQRSGSGGPILEANNCSGLHALWKAAASDGSETAPAAQKSGDAVLQLPKRLRALVSTRIAHSLVEAESWALAKKFYDIALDAAGAENADLKFIQAQLIGHEGRAGDARKMLLEVAAERDGAAKDALLALAEKYAEGGETPYEGYIDDIGALAMSERGTKTGAEAAYREAMAWAGVGNIEAAVMLLQNAALGPGLDGAAAASAREILQEAFDSEETDQRLAALRAFADNRKFIEYGSTSPGLIAAAAETAVQFGLPNLAMDFLAAENGANEPATLLKARAALRADEPEAALAAAAPYANEPEFAAILTNANFALDQEYAALAAASGAQDFAEKPALVAGAAWRAGDWRTASRAFSKIDPTVMTSGEALQFALSAYMAGESAAPPSAIAVLKQKNSNAVDGVESLFGAPSQGTIVERGKSLVNGAQQEIDLIKRMLGNG